MAWRPFSIGDLRRTQGELLVTSPRVTVLMSVYNGEQYLAEAIESILRQTFQDFEFLIVDDGSKDRSKEIIESFQDSRVRLISRSNKGLTASLNEGIKKARGVLDRLPGQGGKAR